MPASNVAVAARPKLRQRFERVLHQLERLAELAGQAEVCALQSKKVSRWRIAEHFDHMLITSGLMVGAIEHAISDPPPFADKWAAPIAHVPLLFGFIPRGKGKAPPESLPTQKGPRELAALADEVLAKIRGLEGKLDLIAASTGRAKHPVMGYLSAAQWLRLMEVHNRHHWAIIGDIRKAVA